MRAKEPQDDVEVSLGKAKSTLFLYSTVSAKHKEKSLFFGSAWAFFGVLILTIAGTQIPKDILITYGWLIFLIGGGMIGCGLVPYAKWRNLDRSPHRLTCENSHILFFLHGSPTYSVSSDSVSHTAEASLGIKVWLKPGHLPAPLNSRLSIE
ncbi:MAG: hypothetical protein KDK40_05805, partial [Chlamydiia bacterium]|nr:hypothetical protein [Chlamydiia bacterium]